MLDQQRTDSGVHLTQVSHLVGCRNGWLVVDRRVRLSLPIQSSKIKCLLASSAFLLLTLQLAVHVVSVHKSTAASSLMAHCFEHCKVRFP